jgi:signal transduction histidine kinase
MGRDRKGRVWLGYTHSHVAVVEGTAARSWGPGEGLRVGAVSILVPTDDGMLIGGTEGLALLVDGTVTMLQDAQGERLDTVGGIVQSSDGDWWIHAGRDVVRLTQDELAQARSKRDHRVALERFGPSDGLRGTAAALYPSPSAVRTSDDRLWFSTVSALHVVDPARLQRNTRPPAVELRGLRVEGEAQGLSSATKALPVGTRRIEFSFAAVHIGAPERVRYRYQLSGVDAKWQTTADRSATYTNLAPGDYVFRMSAANEDGVWNEEGASTRFTIPPAFHQTAWFYVLCALALGGLAGSAYLMRGRQITARVRLRAEARARERERIARDLHDTLLQSTHGLMLTVQALADRTPADHPDKARIERALENADRAVLEGRQKVLDLRGDDGDSDGVLPLQALVHEMLDRGPASVALRVEGTPRRLVAEARSELLQVAREAIVNAQRHARAQHIDVILDFAPARLVLRVDDDGVGMPPELRDGSQTRPGRFGLTGLRERASGLDASLSVGGGARGGTLVELSVPAARAYKT